MSEEDRERYENQDRYRSRGQDFYRGQEQSRRYTRPDYDSDLDIERPGQARFGSRGSHGSSFGNDYGSSDYGREYGRDFGRGESSRDFGRDYGQNYGRDSGRDFDYESSERWNRPSRSQRSQDRYEPSYRSDSSREWEGSSIGHADWGARGEWNRSNSHDPSWGRGSYDQQSRLNEQKNRWPKSFKRNDERLKDDIHEELIRHGHIDASDIEVQVKDGEVTLTGQVVSRHDKRIAEELAEKVLGVHDVQNQLKVKQQQQHQSDDQQKSGSPSLPGSNRASTLGSQQDQTKAASSSNK